jgi:hypothetical protein
MPAKPRSEVRLRAAWNQDESFTSCSRLPCYAIPVLALLVARSFLPVTLCDDAFITFKVALNTASGLGMVFNPGENTYVSTSPAWVLLLACSRWMFGDVVLAAKTLGTVFEVLLVLSVVHLGARTGPGPVAGMFAALLLVTNPVFLLTSFSGMELPLYLLAIVLTALFLSRHQYAVAMALAAGAVWVRFDGIVVLAVALLMATWHERQQLRTRPASVLVTMVPAAFIVLAYIVFGAVFFETWVPMSVQRKMLTSADLLSPAWLDAAGLVSREFGNAFLGKSAYWYTHATAFPLMIAPFFIGMLRHLRLRQASTVPLLLITLVYVAVFTGSGSSYAVNFPWYFVPVLPAACLMCGAGVAWLLAAVSGISPFPDGAGRVVVLPALAAVCWLLLSSNPLRNDADALVNSWGNERERVYATAAVWTGRHVGQDAVVAANEIGAIGFFLPPGSYLIDMFGLLSRKDMLQVPFDRRIQMGLPCCIFTRAHFSYMKTIHAGMEDSYRWFAFRSLNIGIRSDMLESLRPQLSRFQTIYETIDVDSEYQWDSASNGNPLRSTGVAGEAVSSRAMPRVQLSAPAISRM